ncbi:MAG: DUF6677 family protein [Thermoguttaceae bacterium]
MAENNESQSTDQSIQLKDPLIAGVLAWLIPGLGHFYQGRNAKGALFTICILGTFLYGLYLGGSTEAGWGRAVYFSFRANDWHLPWLCQIGVGFPTVPMTLLQSELKEPILNGFMAPPLLPASDSLGNGPPGIPPSPSQMSSAWINRLLPRYYEMGTVYTMIAGLLNILAVYDACCGPVPAESAPKEDEKPQGERDADTGEDKA